MERRILLKVAFKKEKEREGQYSNRLYFFAVAAVPLPNFIHRLEGLEMIPDCRINIDGAELKPVITDL